MPFTLAHIAVVMPLRKSTWVSYSALVAGSMIPDFEFFLQLRETENIGHHWYGILLFDMPAAFMACFLFHNLVRNNVLKNLPARFQYAYAPLMNFNWNVYFMANPLKVLAGLLIGIISHLLLDGFTHYDGMFVSMLPFLAGQSNFYNLPLYSILQIVLSIAGMMLLFLSFPKQQPATASHQKEISAGYWITIASFVLGIMLVRLGFFPQYNSFWGVVMAFLGSVIYAFVAVSLLQFSQIKKYL